MIPQPTIQVISVLSALAWFFFVLRREVIRDFTSWKAGRYSDIDHRSGWKRRAYWLIPCIGLLTIGLQPHGWRLLVAGLLSTAFVAFTWWLLFDGWFNRIRGYKWWFTGSNDADDAYTDNLLQQLPIWQHIALKVGGCIAFTFLYYFLCS